MGPSGSGKTTLLNILGAMDNASSGELWFDHQELTFLKKKEQMKFRREKIGFVFQFYNLIPTLTALENVKVSEKLGVHAYDSKEMLSKVGLADRLQHFPKALSGGEQQRVAIARAPQLLLCDEPTGALDSGTEKEILTLLQQLNRTNHHTVIMVTHNAEIAQIADRVIRMKDGELVENHFCSEPKKVEEMKW